MYILNSKKLFVCSDGHLYNTENKNWAEDPIRLNYYNHFPIIDSTQKLKACLRAGECTTLGGYPLYFVTKDGGVLSFESVRNNLFEVLSAIKDQDDPQWEVISLEINYVDNNLYCDYSSDLILSAYGDDNND